MKSTNSLLPFDQLDPLQRYDYVTTRRPEGDRKLSDDISACLLIQNTCATSVLDLIT